jgi:hypothetical protein
MKNQENHPQDNGAKHKFCSLPLVPERKLDDHIAPGREGLIRYNEKKWVNQTILHYHFMREPQRWRGTDAQKQAVREAIDTWQGLGEKGIGLQFQEVNDPSDAEIRIAFLSGRSWSYVGRDSIDLVPEPALPTMNFGWNLTTEYGRDTALHEIGHALGFSHEHQNPNAGIIWNEDLIYSHFEGSPNFWDRATTYRNILRKLSQNEVTGSSWDKDSIMHYIFEKGLILTPPEFQEVSLIPEPGLSEGDVEETLKFYPPREEVQIKTLEPFLSQIIDIKSGQQLDFEINPPRTRNYTIQTFGEMDTVIVLFEDLKGRPLFIAGKDDSGYNTNSKITARLIKGKKYYLRVRLYFISESSQGAVMLW